MIRSMVNKLLSLSFSLPFVGGCSTSEFRTVISSYAMIEKTYEDVGYSKEKWEIQPLMNLENGVSIKIHPSSWSSLTSNKDYCSNDFYVMLWSQSDLVFESNESYFISKDGEKVLIESVSQAESKGRIEL